MLGYIVKRILRSIPQFFLLSILCFVIIQLPPGDFLTERLQRLEALGTEFDQETIERWREYYGLDQPMYVQYLKWIWRILTRFDFGYSHTRNEPVLDIIAGRVPLTFAIALGAAITTWIIAIPIGIFVSVRQYSIFDYFFTILGFIGLAVPGFLLAMVVMYFAYTKFGIKVGGLFSSEMRLEPWSWAKFVDLMQHIWVPVLLIGIGGTAGMIRTLRATMLDELRKQYVTVARSKGLSEFQVLMRYPVRLAINPIISGLMWLLPYLFSGGLIVEIVLNLPTAGPSMYEALTSQDMYLAGSYMLIIGVLTSLGGLLSDILLAVVDPRIRFESVETL
jgi:peptide/nickel transport system permease protein